MVLETLTMDILLQPAGATLSRLTQPLAHGALAGAERGLWPDALVRAGIRQLCAQRLKTEGAGDVEQANARYRRALADWPLAARARSWAICRKAGATPLPARWCTRC